jgi:two-component system OmpR family sensor kinase
METDVDELKALVDELLSLTQLEHAQAMHRDAFALAPLLQACTPPGTQHFSASIAADLGELQGDPRLLARAINNLLGNAAKYAQSRITLSATRDDEQLRIVIEDDGPGIPAEARAQVFEPFYRLARDVDHTAGGYGLGLSIAARAIQLHGGEIAVDTSLLSGARFTIVL